MRIAYESHYSQSSKKPATNLKKEFGVVFELPMTKEEIEARDAELAIQAERVLCMSLGLKYQEYTQDESKLDLESN